GGGHQRQVQGSDGQDQREVRALPRPNSSRNRGGLFWRRSLREAGHGRVPGQARSPLRRPCGSLEVRRPHGRKGRRRQEGTVTVPTGHGRPSKTNGRAFTKRPPVLLYAFLLSKR